MTEIGSLYFSDLPRFRLQNKILRDIESLRYMVLISLDVVLLCQEFCFSNNMKRKVPPLNLPP